jgi:hypothetical protein
MPRSPVSVNATKPTPVTRATTNEETAIRPNRDDHGSALLRRRGRSRGCIRASRGRRLSSLLKPVRQTRTCGPRARLSFEDPVIRFTARLIIRQRWTGSTAVLAGIRTPMPRQPAVRGAVVTRLGSLLERFSAPTSAGRCGDGRQVFSAPICGCLACSPTTGRSEPGFAQVRAADPDRDDRDDQSEHHRRGRDHEGAGEPGRERVVVDRGERGPTGLP